MEALGSNHESCYFLFWTRHGTEDFLGPGIRIGVPARTNRDWTSRDRGVSIPLLLLAGWMIVPENLDPDGCMVQ